MRNDKLNKYSDSRAKESINLTSQLNHLKQFLSKVFMK